MKLDKITTGPLIPAFQSVSEGHLQDFIHILGIMKKYFKMVSLSLFDNVSFVTETQVFGFIN